MVTLYDKLGLNEDILLDLPFREGIGVITHDVAKPHHLFTLRDPGGGSFTWTTLPSGLMVPVFAAVGGGLTDGVYMDCPGADTADLDFTNGDYSLGGWINWDSTGGTSQYIIGRGAVAVGGWDIYLDISSGRNTLSHRHHHAGINGNSSNSYSEGFTPGTTAFFGISRTGGDLYPKHYRNGVEIGVTYEASGMLDPATSNADVVIGARDTKDAYWYRNWMRGIRAWGRALTADDWMNAYQIEKRWF